MTKKLKKPMLFALALIFSIGLLSACGSSTTDSPNVLKTATITKYETSKDKDTDNPQYKYTYKAKTGKEYFVVIHTHKSFVSNQVPKIDETNDPDLKPFINQPSLTKNHKLTFTQWSIKSNVNKDKPSIEFKTDPKTSKLTINAYS